MEVGFSFQAAAHALMSAANERPGLPDRLQLAATLDEDGGDTEVGDEKPGLVLVGVSQDLGLGTTTTPAPIRRG